MSLRWLLRALCAASVLGSVAALGVTAIPATAEATSGPPGWRIIRETGLKGQVAGFADVAASGPRNAWAVGCRDCAVPQQLVERWDGTSWRQAPLPASIAKNDFPDSVATSSSRNVWLFSSSLTSKSAVAVRWNGTHWTARTLPLWVVRIDGAGTDVAGPAAFGRGNVWYFSLFARVSPALAAHFDGHSWHRVFLPGEPQAVSAQSASDIWAVGPSRKTMNTAHPVDVAMHWNGRTWHSTRLPAVTAKPPLSSIPLGMLALSPRNVWVMMTSGSVSRQTAVMLHWNGLRWSRVRLPNNGAGLVGSEQGVPLVQDGHGGFWFGEKGSSAPFRLFMYHYSGGRFTRQRMPQGAQVGLGSLSWIPRTRSVWAVGSISDGPGNTVHALIAKDGR